MDTGYCLPAIASRSPVLTGPGRAGEAPPSRDRPGGDTRYLLERSGNPDLSGILVA